MNIVITGANRGIGLGLVEKFIGKGHTVWACCRNPHGARELWEMERDYGDRLRTTELDVTSEREITALKENFFETPVDLLINNAGVFPETSTSLAEMTAENMTKAFSVNTLGPALVSQALLKSLMMTAEPKVVNITSKMGSLADNTSGAYYAYRVSKCGLNMFNKSFAIDCPKVTSVVVHPGWVQTDMGGKSAPTTIEQSVDGIFNLIMELSIKDSGKFLDYLGKEIPW